MGSSIAFEVGPVVVHWYGLLIVVGILSGGLVATWEARRRGEDPEHVWYGLIWCIIFGFLGARLYHILSSPADGTGGLSAYLDDPIAIFRAWDGGLGIIGAVAGGVVGLLLYTRRHQLNSWLWLDIATPGLVLAQAVGRWSNLINQELYGPPTRLPWGLSIGAEHRIPRYSDLTRYPVDTTRFHPTFLYDSLWSLGVFAFLLWAERRWRDRLHDGDLFLAYLVLYGLGRLWIEQFFRPDAWRLDNGLAVASVVSFFAALGAGLLLLMRHRGTRAQRQGLPQQH